MIRKILSFPFRVLGVILLGLSFASLFIYSVTLHGWSKGAKNFEKVIDQLSIGFD